MSYSYHDAVAMTLEESEAHKFRRMQTCNSRKWIAYSPACNVRKYEPSGSEFDTPCRHYV